MVRLAPGIEAEPAQRLPRRRKDATGQGLALLGPEPDLAARHQMPVPGRACGWASGPAWSLACGGCGRPEAAPRVRRAEGVDHARGGLGLAARRGGRTVLMGERCYGPPDPIALGQALLGRDWRLWSRQPRPLDAYRAAGVRCVVTNTRAQERYGGGPGAATDFPSFVRSYGELARPESLKVIDPAGWNGKGPVVLIHDPLSTGRAGADAPDGG